MPKIIDMRLYSRLILYSFVCHVLSEHCPAVNPQPGKNGSAIPPNPSRLCGTCYLTDRSESSCNDFLRLNAIPRRPTPGPSPASGLAVDALTPTFYHPPLRRMLFSFPTIHRWHLGIFPNLPSCTGQLSSCVRLDKRHMRTHGILETLPN